MADLEFRIYHQPLFLGKFDKIYILQFAVIAILILGIVFRLHIMQKSKAA
jgi:hypothetical protein